MERDFGHDLVKAYLGLDDVRRILSSDELSTLEAANAMYVDRGFEYMSPFDAGSAFSHAPDLAVLDTMATKLIQDAE